MSISFLEADDFRRKKETYDGKLLVTVGPDDGYKNIVTSDDPKDILWDMYHHNIHGGIKNLENVTVERIKIRDDGSTEIKEIDLKRLAKDFRVYPAHVDEGKLHIDLQNPVPII